MAFTPDPQTTIQRYLDAWNAADADRRWSLVHAAAAEDVVVLDAATDAPVEGRAALTAYLDHARQRDGGRLEAAGPSRLVHGTIGLPVRWADGGAVVRTGFLVGTLDREGRMARVVHFVDGA